MDKLEPKNKADIGFLLILLPVTTVVIGIVVSKNINGWNSIAFFYMFLVLSGFLSLAPVSFGILAFKNKTKKKEKALMSIFIPFMTLFLFCITFGGNI